MTNCPGLSAQTPKDEFDVTSVKLMEPNSTAIRLQVDPANMIMSGFTLKFLVAYAYGIFDFQIVGGPSWLNETKFDVEGKMDQQETLPSNSTNNPGTDRDVSTALLQKRLRNLLADRFGLVIHVGQREMPSYSLIVGDHGQKFQSSTTDEGFITGRRYLKATHMSMSELAELITTAVHVPVIDHTNLHDAYQFSLSWGDPVLEPDSNFPDIFAAVQEQLGLKLIYGKQLVTVRIIDHVELPSPN